MFLPQRPYLPSGTLREMLVNPEAESEIIPDDQIVRVLHEAGLERLFNQVGGLDVEQNWEKILPLSEQHLLALASVLLAAPRFVVLDRLEMTLGAEQFRKILRLLFERSITCINIGKAVAERNLYQAFLEYGEDGRWTWTDDPPINRGH